MKDLVIGLSLLGMVSACSPAPQAKDNVEEDYCQYVNPFIGNADNGHTFPGACAPFGYRQAPNPELAPGDTVRDIIMKITLSKVSLKRI